MGDVLMQPGHRRIRQIHGLSAEMDPGQAVIAFEVLDYVPVVRGVADLRNAEE